MITMKNGVLHKDGKPVFGLGISYYASFHPEKRTVQAEGEITDGADWLAPLSGTKVEGYEIHSGANTFGEGCRFWMKNGDNDGACNAAGNVLGTYLHGLFDDGQLADALVKRARILKGLPGEEVSREQAAVNMKAYREAQFDKLARVVRENLDMDKVYAILKGKL